MPKAVNDPGLKIPDFVMHAVGRQGFAPDFASVFHGQDPKQVSYGGIGSQDRAFDPVMVQFTVGVMRRLHYDAGGGKGMDVTADWFWEGNVVEAIARFLADEGWTIVGKADTHSKERGVDIQAARGGRTLLIEAKGYPAKTYRDPRRAGEIKPTNPTNQAQQWYSHALLKAMRLQTKHPGALVALGFPDFPRYRVLFEETRGGLAKLGVAMLTVRADASVETWGLHGQD